MFDPANRIARIHQFVDQAKGELPTMPEIVHKVLAESERPDSSPVSLERLITTDAALTAKCLRIANSVYYGLPREVNSVSQAVLIMGMRQVKNLVLSVAAISLMTPRTPRQRDYFLQFWKRSLGAACAAEWLAGNALMTAFDVDNSFIGGLLHDIGEMVLYSQLGEPYVQALATASAQGVSQSRLEFELLGFDHADLGAAFAVRWSLPDAIDLAIRLHEDPDPIDGVPGCVRRGVLCVQEALAPSDSPAESALGLEPECAEHLKEHVRERVAQAGALFGLLA